MRIRLIFLFVWAALIASGPLYSFDLQAETDQPLWIALPGLDAEQRETYLQDFDLRGAYEGLTLVVGNHATLERLGRIGLTARALGPVDASQRLYVVHLGPRDRLLQPVGSQTLLRTPALALVSLPGEARLGAHEFVDRFGEPLFHGGVIVVPNRAQRPQRQAPGRFRSDTGLRAVLYDGRIQTWVDSISAANLEADVLTLSTIFTTRRSDTQGGRDAQLWIAQRFDDLGLTTGLHDFDGNADNVVAELPGAVEPERVVIVGAHYDSTSSGGVAPGADDNASGTAALLEIARALSDGDASFRYTLRFIAFASEEFGLLGSEAYSSLMVSQGVDVIAMLNVDMNAYRLASDGLDLDMVVNDTTPWLNDLVREIAQFYVPELPTTEGSLSGGTSDHRPFFRDGFPAVFYFEDTGDHSPFIHTPNDVVGLSANDFALSRGIVQAVLAGAAVLADPVEADTDGDGVADHLDNCILVANGPLIPDAGGYSQRDTDADGYGNICDPDLENSLFVNAADLAIFRPLFFSNDPDADFDGSGTVNAADLAIMKTMFFGPPGPSGIAP